MPLLRTYGFYQPMTIGKLHFEKFQGAKTLFLEKSLCENVPRELHRDLQYFSPAYVADGLCIQQPGSDIVDWAESLGIEFCVYQMWPDGCDIFVYKPSDAVMFMLRWGIKPT